MNLKSVFKSTLFILAISESAIAADDQSRNNYVDWIVASAKSSSLGHLVQWKNPIHESCTNNRTRFSSEDKEVMSLLLAAKMSGKKVGVYYNYSTNIPYIPGHGSNCQIVNVWLESD